MHRIVRASIRAVIATAFLSLIPAAAHAQFGGLIKKATQAAAQNKVEEKVAQRTRPAAPGEALTSATFTQVLAGARAGDKVLATRDQAVATRDADQMALNQMTLANDPARAAYQQANSAVSECRDANMNKLEEAFQKEMDTKMKNLASDPNAVGRMQLVAMKYGRAMAEAQQKNDAAALERANRDMQNELLGVDIRAKLKADTVATDAKCGKLPAPPAALVKEDALRAKIDAANDNIRTFEAQAIQAGTKASGLDQLRYLQLKERLYTIYLDPTGAHSAYAYGDAELALVKDHRAELDQIKRAL